MMDLNDRQHLPLSGCQILAKDEDDRMLGRPNDTPEFVCVCVNTSPRPDAPPAQLIDRSA